MQSRCLRVKTFHLLICIVSLLIISGCGNNTSTTKSKENKRSSKIRTEETQTTFSKEVEEETSNVAENEEVKVLDRTPEEYRNTIDVDRDFVVTTDKNGYVVIDGGGTDGFVPNTYDWGKIKRVFLIGNGLLGVEDNGKLHLSKWPDLNRSNYTSKEYVDFTVAFGQILGLTAEGSVNFIHEDEWYYGMYGITREEFTSYFKDKSIKKIGGDMGGIGEISFSISWCYLTTDGKVDMISNTYATSDDYKDEDEQYFEGIKDEISTWEDIVDISVSADHILGLKSDGTVVAAGRNDNGQCSVDDWNNIVMISAGQGHSVGLDSEGKVLACGANGYGQTDVGEWKNIICVRAGGFGTIAIDEEGHHFYKGNIEIKNIAKIDDVDIDNTSASEESVVVTDSPSVQNSNDNKEHKCEVDNCPNVGTYAIAGVSGKTEYYCYEHYKEMESILEEMESDIGTNNIEKHTCEVCSKEGTHSIIGISGATEYYCTEHYNELIEIINSLSD